MLAHWKQKVIHLLSHVFIMLQLFSFYFIAFIPCNVFIVIYVSLLNKSYYIGS